MAGLTWIKLHMNPWANVSKFEDVSVTSLIIQLQR